MERWLDAVQELLSRDATGMGDTESLREELNQCKVREKCNKKTNTGGNDAQTAQKST